MSWNPFERQPEALSLRIKLSDEALASFREGNGHIEVHCDGYIFVPKKNRDYWFSKWAEECSDKVIAQYLLRKVSSLVFRRLNTAIDHRDHRAEKIYREIQEAMR